MSALNTSNMSSTPTPTPTTSKPKQIIEPFQPKEVNGKYISHVMEHGIPSVIKIKQAKLKKSAHGFTITGNFADLIDAIEEWNATPFPKKETDIVREYQGTQFCFANNGYYCNVEVPAGNVYVGKAFVKLNIFRLQGSEEYQCNVKLLHFARSKVLERHTFSDSDEE